MLDFLLAYIEMSLAQNILQIQHVINDTALTCARKPDSITLLAVTKQQNVATIEQAAKLGLQHFGESYYQEAEKKIKQLHHMNLVWHFIGPIQSNKTKGISSHFSWVHSVNRHDIAEKLNRYRASNQPPLNVCIQVNVVEEATKSGISSKEAKQLAYQISQYPMLRLRGLMTIPPPVKTEQEQLIHFLQLTHLLHALNKELALSMDTLSMGMSEDIIPAIRAGATIVRIGRALFGERK